jgi:hypothetical protein
MAKQDQKAKREAIKNRMKKAVYTSINRGIVGRLRTLWAFLTADLKGWLGKYSKKPIGIMVGFNVSTAAIAVTTKLENGTDVTVVTNSEGAKQLIWELNEAINALKFKGNR